MHNTRLTSLSLAAALLLAALPLAQAQNADPAGRAARPEVRQTGAPDAIKTFYLQPSGDANYGNEIMSTARWMVDPSVRFWLVTASNAIMVRATPENMAVVQQIITELDKPKPNYKLTYSLAESEGTKRLGVQHFTLDLIPGVRTTLKNGSKVPVATGSYNNGNSTSQMQFTYLDIGLNFDATLDPGVGGMRLRSKIEQSATTEDKIIGGVNEAVVRQTVFEGSATLTVGKPLSLGSIDIAGTNRHLDVEVLLELAK